MPVMKVEQPRLDCRDCIFQGINSDTITACYTILWIQPGCDLGQCRSQRLPDDPINPLPVTKKLGVHPAMPGGAGIGFNSRPLSEFQGASGFAARRRKFDQHRNEIRRSRRSLAARADGFPLATVRSFASGSARPANVRTGGSPPTLPAPVPRLRVPPARTCRAPRS